jgi:alpha-D-ribose 1-methylphosphonate 5-triphosphate synthase subunit PhnH
VTGVLPGFVDPVLDSQRIFRGVLDAMAHPGRVVALDHLPPAPVRLHAATVAVCLALVDLETPLWLDAAARTPETVAHLRFHGGCPVVDEPELARFAVVADPAHMPELDGFDPGTDEYPDCSAWIIVQARTLAPGAGKRLTGPGIESEHWLDAEGLSDRFWDGLRMNHGRFPRGVDVVLTAGASLAALPRTTWVEG